MVEVSKRLRMAIYNALNGNITVSINGIPTLIPVRDEVAFENENVYILIGAVSEENEDTILNFITQTTFELLIVGKTSYGVTKDVVDDIDGEISEILIPNKTSNGLGVDSALQFVSLFRDRGQHIEATQGNSTMIIQKSVTYSLKINQK